MTDDQRTPDETADAHPSTASIAGHPIHPMLVPVPIGTLAAAAACDLFWSQTRDPFWARAGSWLLGGSLVSAAAAGPFGLIDFLTIPAARRRPEAWLHAVGNVGVASMAAASLALRRRNPDRVDAAPMALSLGAASLLVLTGWLGGELSYRHRIGVAASRSTTSDDANAGDGTTKTRKRRTTAASAGQTARPRGRGALSAETGDAHSSAGAASGGTRRRGSRAASDDGERVGIAVMDEDATPAAATGSPSPAR